MLLSQLEAIVGPFAYEILLTMEKKSFQPKFTGIVKGRPFSSDDLTVYYPRRPHVSDDIFLRVVHVDDFSMNMGDLPVVVAVGINHGKFTEADILKCRGEVSVPTGLRERLDEAFAMVKTRNLHHSPPAAGAYHLVSVNLFPWVTNKPWDALGINKLEEALLLNLHGYRADDLLAPLEDLLRKLVGVDGKPVIWIVFHGSNNSVPLFGALYAKRNDWTHPPEIMICDDLRATGPIENCIVVERPPKDRGDMDGGNVDE